MLADWVLNNKNIFENKTVLELGSGVGFTGITVGKLTNVKSLLLTDCHYDVLKTINKNIEINFPNTKRCDHAYGTVYNITSEKSLGLYTHFISKILFLPP